MKSLEYNIQPILRTLINEQTISTVVNTDNAKSDAVDSPFTPAEEAFLGQFDSKGSKHLGILYSTSDVGVREIMIRSGKELNLTPGILLSLLRQNIIKIVPYTGYGRDSDYTIELQLSLNDVKGLGNQGSKQGSAAGGAAAAPFPEPEATIPGMEVAWVVKYGDVLKETANITKKLILEKQTKKEDNKAEVYSNKSRILRKLPKQYIVYLERVINAMIRFNKSNFDKQRLIADILDNLQVNFNMTTDQIRRSYDFHRNQKRLQKELNSAKTK